MSVADQVRRRRWPLLIGCGSTGVIGIAVLGCVMAITGATFSLPCGGSSTGGDDGPDGPAVTAAAKDQIPPSRLKLYQAAGRRFNIDWTFLASIGAQECNHGDCRGENSSGCSGPMQIASRRGSPCSPGAGPTIFETYGYDGNRDGRKDVNDPADAIFTAARILRQAKGAPPTGGSYQDYRQAACGYYGACADAVAQYADTVMKRAVAYGFGGPGAPPHPTPDPATTGPAAATPGCGGEDAGLAGIDGSGGFGKVKRVYAPRKLKTLPASVGAGGGIQCDARIVPDVVYLARRFNVLVTACASIHSQAGEHPLGAAVDLVPQPGHSWPESTGALAHAIGWKSSCAASGVAPDCARPPFRFAGYNGYPNHGDPEHCVPCSGGAHLHLSWLTSASPGEPQNAPRTTLFAPAWISTFTPKQGATP